MKKLSLLFILSVMLISSAIAGEINYFTGTWAEVKAKAKAEHKYIFVDCYTDWCGWCKVMDKQTMPDAGVVGIMNDKFIATKIDMEKGEGISLAMKYHISGYPAFLFFDPEGQYVFQGFGYSEPKDFIKTLTDALDKSKQVSAPGYSNSLNVPYPDMLKKAYAGNGKRTYPKEEEVTAYLSKQKDLFSEANWAVMAQFHLNAKFEKFFFDNRAKYQKLYGRFSVQEKIDNIIGSNMQKAMKEKDETKFEAALKMIDKYVTDDAEGTKANYRISFYKETKNWSKCVTAVNNLIKTKGDADPNYINSLSWDMYEHCTDKAALKSAIEWMKTVIAKAPQYAYLDTYAALLSVAGDKKEAEEMAAKAIEVGKQAGEKTESTEQLLKKLKETK